MNPYEILLYPLMGEKATLIREKENTLTFIVAKKATKKQVKDAVEKIYGVKVDRINTMMTIDGLKKAHVKLNEKHNAEEIASHLGVI
ncbi:MAG TPA: 50S ribosomal protein L23 [Candidatus Altiarchaeales archaeon]|nr:50S ribosomal protein L23 [Candidatus Altiarchaeales archaeon]